MACGRILKGFDDRCIDIERRYIQKAVLLNKEHVEFHNIISTDLKNRIIFGLSNDPNKDTSDTGYPFYSLDTGDVIKGSFSMSMVRGVPNYKHEISIRVSGADENTKVLFKQLDKANMFGALKFSDGSIEIYGFNYGLKTTPYNYSATNGGQEITLESIFNEYDPPYIYYGDAIDFDNDWNYDDQNNPLLGEFNNDFNDDFKRSY